MLPSWFEIYQQQLQKRILTLKGILPSSTLIVTLFLEQGVEIRNLKHEVRVHPIRIQLLQPCKMFQLLNLEREGGEDFISTPCSRNRITNKVQLDQFSLIVKILFPQQSVFERTLQPKILQTQGKNFFSLKCQGKNIFNIKRIYFIFSTLKH